MANQEFLRASPKEGFSIARQAMVDAVDFHLANGGPDEARKHVERLANELKFYDDCTETYRDALARIAAAEKAEQLKAEERNRQQMQNMVMSMLGVAKPDQPTVQLPSEVERMKYALDGLKKEGLLIHKYDYVWIMRYINEKHIKELNLFFYSVNSYRDYVITYMGHQQVAGISTLSQYYSCGDGRFPDWTFSDTNDSNEILRRINVARRFAALFVKGR